MSRMEKAPLLGATAESTSASLSTARAVGTKDGNTRFWRLRCVADGKSTLGDNGEYNRPSAGAVRTEDCRRIESGSIGRHQWSFGKRGSDMTQEVLGPLPGRGSRAGRAALRWIKASRLMRRKTSTDIVKFESDVPK